MDKYKWRKEPYDSEILNFKVAKIESLKKDIFISDLIADLDQKKIDYAIFRVEATNIKLIQKLEKAGFILVDGSVSLSQTIQIINKEKNIRSARMEDKKYLADIARFAFRSTRFFNDSVISLKKAQNIYAQWVINSVDKVAADDVYVYQEEKNILGFVALKRDHISLIAVEKTSQGKGIGKKLINFALGKLKENGYKNAQIETQINNTRALRAYESCGFRITKSYFTLRIILPSSSLNR